MKESDIPGLLELKIEYESRLASMKEYQDLRSEFERASMSLIKEAILSKGIKLEGELAASVVTSKPIQGGGCGFCTACITSCTSCVFHVAE